MRIGDIDFPPEIIQALGEGTLVVFAGAGVSMDPPSNYPDFDGLVTKIAEGTIYTKKEDEPLDRFLGKLKHEKVEVHRQVKKLLTNPDSKPNPTHTAIVKLFANGKPLRIITTNFDMHFTKVINNLNLPVKTFQAPALPVGSRFKGLAYIHGSVDDSAENLVLTDSDFGRAYVTEGWARRFLQGVYDNFTVLFIGHSHNDVILNYLTRGLSTDNLKLYAVVPDDDQIERWSYLGIEPIPYKCSADGENPHINLLKGIQRLAEKINMGMLEHEERVKQILSAAPPVVDSEDDHYLISVVKDPIKVAFFIKHAVSEGWMIWAEERGLLSLLFQSNISDDPRISALAYWLSEKHLLKDPDSVLGLFQRNNQNMSPTFWGAITHSLHANDELHKDVIKKWVPLLIQHFPLGVKPDLLEYLFDKCAENDLSLSLFLFEFLTRPQIKLEKGFAISDDGKRPTSIQIIIIGDGHWLSEALEKHFKPNMEKIAEHLIQITSSHIQTAFELGKLYGRADKNWDSLSYRRSAIEPNTQDEYPDNFSLVIDVCRESLSWLVKNKNSYAKQIIDEWIKSPAPLLRRLAVFGKSEDI